MFPLLYSLFLRRRKKKSWNLFKAWNRLFRVVSFLECLFMADYTVKIRKISRIFWNYNMQNIQYAKSVLSAYKLFMFWKFFWDIELMECLDVDWVLLVQLNWRSKVRVQYGLRITHTAMLLSRCGLFVWFQIWEKSNILECRQEQCGFCFIAG